MGFGSLFKKIVNPFSMLPGKAGRIGSIVSGNIIPGMMGGSGSNRHARLMPGAQNFLNTFSPEAQASLKAGFRPEVNGMTGEDALNAQLNDWYRTAVGAGHVQSVDPNAFSSPLGGGASLQNRLAAFNWAGPGQKILPGMEPGGPLANMSGGGPWMGSALGGAAQQAFGTTPPPAAPAPPPPTDYQALEEERKRKQAQRAGYAINKPPAA